MNQHDFVKGCQDYYQSSGLTPGDPSDGVWEKAHYPVPQCEGGTEWVWLLHDHHQVQGVLQSEEYGRKCFWESHVKKFLLTGPFVEDWFGLCELYKKWSAEHTRQTAQKVHAKKDEQGRSLVGVKGGLASRAEKDGLGRSVNAVRAAEASHRERDEQGRSVRGLKWAYEGNRAALAEKNEEGKSVTCSKGGLAAHAEKNEEGKSVLGVEVCARNFRQKYECLTSGFVSTATAVAAYQRKRGYDSSPSNRRKVDG